MKGKAVISQIPRGIQISEITLLHEKNEKNNPALSPVDSSQKFSSPKRVDRSPRDAKNRVRSKGVIIEGGTQVQADCRALDFLSRIFGKLFTSRLIGNGV